MAWARWLLAAMAVMAFAACSQNGKKQNAAEVRFIHASVDTEALDVLVDDDTKASALAFASASGVASFSSGGQDTKLKSSTNGTVLLDKTVTYPSASGETLVAYGKRNNLQMTLLTDDATNPDAGKFKVRVFDVAPDAGSVDVYLTSTSSIEGQVASVANVGYGTVTDYSQFAEGNLYLAFAAAGTKEVLFSAPARGFAAGNHYTVLVFPSAGGKLVNAMILDGGSGGAVTYLANGQSRLRAVNADPSSPGFNFLAGTTTLLSSVPFKGVSTYVSTPAGATALSLQSANVPGTAVASSTVTLDAARDYTEIAWSSGGVPQIALVPDDNALPSSGTAKVRFVNAFSSGNPVDVLLNFAGKATGIPARGASAYYEVGPSTSYTVTFTTPGGVTVLATLSPAELDAGAIYSVVGFGDGATAEARLVRDR